MGRTSDAREKLLAVAFDLIHENSYGTVSVEQICERADVNKGSFYYFFKTKTDLVVAAYEEHWQIKRPDYERIFSKRASAACGWRCGAIMSCQVQKSGAHKYGHACGCPYTSLGGLLATSDPKVRRKAQDLIERHVDYLAGAIEDTQDDGRGVRRKCQGQGATGAFVRHRAFIARQNL